MRVLIMEVLLVEFVLKIIIFILFCVIFFCIFWEWFNNVCLVILFCIWIICCLIVFRDLEVVLDLIIGIGIFDDFCFLFLVIVYSFR